MKTTSWLLFLILCFPVAATAQLSLKALPGGHPSFGIGILSKPRHIVGGVEYGLTDSSKAIVEFRVPWQEDNMLIGYSETHLPAIKWARIKPMRSGFESFILAGIDDIEFRDYDTVSLPYVDATGRYLGRQIKYAQKSRNVSFVTSVGFLKHLDTDGMLWKPYLGLRFYATWSTLWEDVSPPFASVNEDEFSGHLRGILGLETELSSSFIVRGEIEFPVDNSDTMFHVGVNYRL